MKLSRRDFLKASAAAPLATLPSIVFATPFPTAMQVLAEGVDVAMPESWTQDQAKLLVVQMGRILAVENEQRSRPLNPDNVADEWDARVDNAIAWVMKYRGDDVYLPIFQVKGYLTTEHLPMLPGYLDTFDQFHKELGPYVIPSVVGGPGYHRDVDVRTLMYDATAEYRKILQTIA